jgi:hypothetical protein
MGKVVEYVHGRGHPNIRAKHQTTLAVTRDLEIGKAGDCFLLVAADKSPSTLSDAFKKAARNPVKMLVKIRVDELEDVFECQGNPALSFNNGHEMVFRKSSYICGKTVGVKSNKSAKDINRSLIRRLKEGHEAVMELTVDP